MTNSSTLNSAPSQLVVRGMTSALCALALTACGAAEHSAAEQASPAPVADAPQAAPALPEQVASVDAKALLKLGKIMFLRCRACHAVDAVEGHKVGPNLSGIIGANIGAKEGFTYSEVLATSDEVWTEERLDGFLTKPSEYFPGTIMAFAGLEKAQDRAAVIAYLKSSTK